MASDNSPISLDSVDEAFDNVVLFVAEVVMVSLFLAVAAGEDDRCDLTNLKLFSEIIIAIG